MKLIMNHVGSLNRISNLRTTIWLTGVALAVSALSVGSGVVRADDAAGAGPMGAARLSLVEGQVGLMQDGQVIAESAPVNAPLFPGTRIETGQDGKAEIQFDDGSVARISPNSALIVQSVGGEGSQGTDLVLDSGLAYFELQGNIQDGQTRVVFSNAMATVSGFTVLRVRMDAPPGDIAVLSGNAHLERGNMAVDIHGGESLTLDASDPNHYNLAENIEPDSWDAWNSDRDQALSANASDQTAATSNFVNSDAPNPEWNDLDANGNWYNVPGQGNVWSPFTASTAGWDPYGCGHWMWTPRFGYIWVSCERWGFLPYSCGSWNFYDGFGWGWAPGMGGCSPWWRRGSYVGWNIGNGPSWYHTVPRPILNHPRGRNPIPVIDVNRHPEGGPNQLPQRGRNNPVLIAGQQVEPMHRLPTHDSYVRSTSGFVYHPSNGYQDRRDGGQVQNDHPPVNNRQVYDRNRNGDSYVRQANPPANSYTPPAQGNNRDQNNQPNNNQPPTMNTQPGRIFVPQPNQNRDQNRGDQNRNFTPPQQIQPQPRTEPNRQYTPPTQYTPPPQPRTEPSRQYTPPPSQHNSGGGNPGGGSYARPASPPPSGGGGFHGGGAPPSGGGGGGGASHGGGGGGNGNSGGNTGHH